MKGRHWESGMKDYSPGHNLSNSYNADYQYLIPDAFFNKELLQNTLGQHVSLIFSLTNYESHEKNRVYYSNPKK